MVGEIVMVMEIVAKDFVKKDQKKKGARVGVWVRGYDIL